MTRAMALPAAVACAIASAALIGAATRPWGLGAVAAIGYAPAFLALAGQRTSVRGALVAGLASLGSTTVGYEAATGIAAWAYPTAVVLGAVPFAVMGAVVTRLRSRLAALPILWCAAEFVPAQSALLGVYALPLAAVGYTQADLPTIYLARFSSVSAVSLVLLTHNALLAAGWRTLRSALDDRACLNAQSREPKTSLLLAAGLIALYLLVPATWRTAQRAAAAAAQSAGAAEVVVRVVQPHLPLAHYVAAEVLENHRAALLEQLLTLSRGRDPEAEPPDFTVWPEAAWPDQLDAESVVAAARTLVGVGPLLFGAYGVESRDTNSAYWFDGSDIRRVYDKRRLVPFAESWLEPGDAGAGTFSAPPNVVVAPVVCYDVVFPEVTRAAALAGADVLIALTDDSFAGASDIPLQHLRLARFRAVETGLPLVHASNSGPSAAYDALGSRVAGSALGSAVAWDALLVTPDAGAAPTPYVRLGDSVGTLAGLLSLAAGVLACFKGGAPSSRQRPT